MKELDASAANQLPPPAISTNSDNKDLLIENYLPNLSNYQKIIKKVKINDQEKIFQLSPNVNFTDQKNYYNF